MLPPDAVARAATRWLRLLRVSTLGQASNIIRSDASYTDLTQTQYASGLDWLRTLELVTDGQRGLKLSPIATDLPEADIDKLLFERILERAAPTWLPDADLLVTEPAGLPEDAASLARTLGLSEHSAFILVRQLHGRVDFAERNRLGAAGEAALVALLERHWPGSTTHISQSDDGFGYDVLFRHSNRQWHLEVKTTTRRGRLVIYLSRHEHEVSLYDPHWRLVVVGLDDKLNLRAIATVQHSELSARAPRDICAASQWQSTSHELNSDNLKKGLSFLPDSTADQPTISGQSYSGTFAWMP